MTQNKETGKLPGYLHFVWMYFMQPMTLHDRLRGCGITQPDITSLTWWRQRNLLNGNYFAYILWQTAVDARAELVAKDLHPSRRGNSLANPQTKKIQKNSLRFTLI